MYDIILKPLIGIEILGVAEVFLGESKKSFLLKLGEPSSLIRGNEFFYDKFEFKIVIDEDETIEFIECLYGVNSKNSNPIIYNEHVFKLYSDKLIQLLLENNSNSTHIIQDSGRIHLLSNISLGLYREFTPDEMNDLIKEMKSHGTYNMNDEDLKHDLMKSKYFDTIGIGIKDYYSNIIENHI